MQTFKVNGQSVPKIVWKQTDGRKDRQSDRQMDGRREAIALPPTLMRSVIINPEPIDSMRIKAVNLEPLSIKQRSSADKTRTFLCYKTCIRTIKTQQYIIIST